MSRDWADDEQQVIDAVPRRWIRRSKLNPEQVKELRQRVDSLTVPWTLEELAHDYGVGKDEIARIAKRRKWVAPGFEPHDYRRKRG